MAVKLMIYHADMYINTYVKPSCRRITWSASRSGADVVVAAEPGPAVRVLADQLQVLDLPIFNLE
jgi:hypothetical protein